MLHTPAIRPQVRYLDGLYTLRNIPGDVQFLRADHPIDNMRLERFPTHNRDK